MNIPRPEKSMLSKADIVQRLLEKKHITAEEAVVLLQSEAPIVNLPQIPVPTFPTPYTPGNPFSPNTFPIYTGTPYIYSTHTHTPQE